VARSAGVEEVHVVDPSADREGFEDLLKRLLASDRPAVVIARRPCLLAARKIRQYRQAAEGGQNDG